MKTVRLKPFQFSYFLMEKPILPFHLNREVERRVCLLLETLDLNMERTVSALQHSPLIYTEKHSKKEKYND